MASEWPDVQKRCDGESMGCCHLHALVDENKRGLRGYMVRTVLLRISFFLPVGMFLSF